MHKTHIFDQKNNAKKNILLTYLPYFFSDRYRKQTIIFFRPYFLYTVMLAEVHLDDIFFNFPQNNVFLNSIN